MPRDLKAMVDETHGEVIPPLTRTSDADREAEDSEIPMFEGETTLEDILSQRNEKRDELHPYTQTLKLSDIESCILLENETFPPQEACTREKFEYRLTKCPELSMGIFTSSEDPKIVTADTSAPVYSGAPERKAVLLGHIIATKSTNPTVTDADMDFPGSGTSDQKVGHREEGSTICVHSLAILSDYQKKGLGKTLMKAYIQRMESHGVGLRLALIAHDTLIPFYESMGFENLGKSDVQFGGGGWFNMIRELKTDDELEDELLE